MHEDNAEVRRVEVFGTQLAFPYGKIEHVHTIGKYTIVQYLDHTRRRVFRAYVETLMIFCVSGVVFDSLDAALIAAVAFNQEGVSISAALYFMRMVNTLEATGVGGNVTEPDVALHTAKTLMNVRPGPPSAFNAQNTMYSDGDADAPLFSEAWLYTAIGKEEARTVLACLGLLLNAAGIVGGLHDARLFYEKKDDG